MVRRNAPKRLRRNNTNPVMAIPSNPYEPCEQCRTAGRRVRLSFSLSEAQEIVEALKDGDLAEYINANLTIARRPESYQYD